MLRQTVPSTGGGNRKDPITEEEGRERGMELGRGTLKMHDKNMQDWNLEDNFARLENWIGRC